VYNTGKNKNNYHSREQIQPVMHVVGTTLTKKYFNGLIPMAI
jgi:hypothetical protein